MTKKARGRDKESGSYKEERALRGHKECKTKRRYTPRTVPSKWSIVKALLSSVKAIAGL